MRELSMAVARTSKLVVALHNSSLPERLVSTLHRFPSRSERLAKLRKSIRFRCFHDGGPRNELAVRSPEVIALEYSDLNLSYTTYQELGNVRVRQHVNPLRSNLSVPAEEPDWNVVFGDATLPLMVDIGCGSGRFLLWLAKRSNSRNYLGLEIREKLVKRANHWVEELCLNNVHFIFANATISFQKLISSYPGKLSFVSILCPDPHFKRKYHKRRMVQKNLVESIVQNLAPGGQIFLQSDVFEVADDMRHHFDDFADKLQHVDTVDPSSLCDQDGWLLHNPIGIRTEREIHAELEGAQMYRRLYQKVV